MGMGFVGTREGKGHDMDAGDQRGFVLEVLGRLRRWMLVEPNTWIRSA